MLSVSIKGYAPACSLSVGGVSTLLVGDALDFDFTPGAANTDGSASGYSAVALRTGATSTGGAGFYEIISLQDSIGVEITQANSEFASSAYEYAISAKAAQLSQAMTNFAMKMDTASVCGQLVFIWVDNIGNIYVAGERSVGGNFIPKFRFKMDASKMSTGKKFSDFNGAELMFKASYLRGPMKFTGGISAITTLQLG
jgi:hypothetical protein